MGICKDCQHFKKETIQFEALKKAYNTWINFANPDVEGASSYDIALCGNELTTQAEITRDETTAYFFEEGSRFANAFGTVAIAGENDTCPNFQAIE